MDQTLSFPKKGSWEAWWGQNGERSVDTVDGWVGAKMSLRSLPSHRASLVAVSKESACSAGDLGSIPRLGRSPEEGNGNPL